MAFIDKTQFNETFQYFDKEIVLEIIEIFINEYPDRIQVLTECIDASDYDKIKFNSHSIKGVIANFVAPDVEQKARELEIMGSNKNIDGINEVFADFKINSAALVEELNILKEEYR